MQSVRSKQGRQGRQVKQGRQGRQVRQVRSVVTRSGAEAGMMTETQKQSLYIPFESGKTQDLFLDVLEASRSF